MTEWSFGADAANIDGLYVYNAKDDSIDTDLGYRGEIKNVLIDQCGVDSKNNHDSAAMEFGNDEDLIKSSLKNITLPKISNLTAYINGGGIYNKYDAGFKLSNIKIISQKPKEKEMVHFRGKESYENAAKFLNGDVCLYNDKTAMPLEAFFSKSNSKEPKKSHTAYDYFVKETKTQGSGKFLVSKKCDGVYEKRVFKGIAGTYKSALDLE